MERHLLLCEDDFLWFTSSYAHPPSNYLWRELDKVVPPTSYPVIVVWERRENSYLCEDFLDYEFVYPGDFVK